LLVKPCGVNALQPVRGREPLLEVLLWGRIRGKCAPSLHLTIPLGRFFDPEDMGTLLFSVLRRASMITGVCKEVDGGAVSDKNLKKFPAQAGIRSHLAK